MSKFKHKDIVFDDNFIKNISENNYYLQSIPNIYNKLYKIYEGEESYIPEDYHLLILGFEKLYKGICKELQDLYPEKIKFSDIVYTNGHRFSQFTATIDEFIPISNNKEGYQKVVDNLHSIELLFSDSRYEVRKSLEEFSIDFRKFENALYRLKNGLEMEYRKVNIEQSEEEDLENW